MQNAEIASLVRQRDYFRERLRTSVAMYRALQQRATSQSVEIVHHVHTGRPHRVLGEGPTIIDGGSYRVVVLQDLATDDIQLVLKDVFNKEYK